MIQLTAEEKAEVVAICDRSKRLNIRPVLTRACNGTAAHQEESE